MGDVADGKSKTLTTLVMSGLVSGVFRHGVHPHILKIASEHFGTIYGNLLRMLTDPLAIVFSGTILFILGQSRLMYAMTFLPLPVLSGFFACVGYSM